MRLFPSTDQKVRGAVANALETERILEAIRSVQTDVSTLRTDTAEQLAEIVKQTTMTNGRVTTIEQGRELTRRVWFIIGKAAGACILIAGVVAGLLQAHLV